jgi:hypothetical protein
MSDAVMSDRRATTKARGRSPTDSFLTPMTAASTTSGCFNRTDSSSAGDTCRHSLSMNWGRVDFKLCLCTNVFVVAGHALVAAITEADRLLTLDLSSLGDGSQLPGRATIANSGLALTQTPHTHTLTRVPCICELRFCHICKTMAMISNV